MKKLLQILGHSLLALILGFFVAFATGFVSVITLCQIDYFQEIYTGSDPTGHAKFIRDTYVRCEGVPGPGWVLDLLILTVVIIVIYKYIKFIKK
ncbi:MAG: hypothetical protein A3I07_02165 [Candidatus Doudnabacteria bacterium RIFCSPLOWO2_02_FULL_42_9]|uniref:Uncharacterized protein n=1 Tax=Candidatus Doudnabacteria bacterium RIFCSPHIGHO2_01_FULL_41_86 TaxID=1817821 RepID=A0A1F5N821_9BACT|nr:MAG: hypothetical protein A2717_04285 [Candidatus Doudnabacteria bacterium RIFCSPHIGHO2_01_FULL_41_86]OGE75319.1 MAG: hypothetical protein A3K07_00820 [Candidatus Doudnabacteria bacterium RIFCSPHIGHO2_01_43_10]OGE85845.1 MAG: hypothetical protein A3E28_03630 [Candidatus Doudnabacteria bacterium RIFCSPHIGHO2_12_FULL_42_22]OGE87339.1 MAG: hypothetical protein A3C49_01250 [Candidatus Doudnabacteria bacterium RIFCSPHIGHO2_02_FULL_42_25]OGE92177.1 MAG: hypothetical protein A2895_01125 [Candidatus